MLKQLTSLLNGDDDTITLKLKKQSGKIRLIVTPSLGALPDDASDAMQKAHEAFSMPLLIVEKVENLESALEKHLESYLPQHQEASYAIEHINRLVGESAKELKERGVSKSKRKKDADDVEVESEGVEEDGERASILESDEQDY